ncbi:MAG: ATP-binding protein [Sedimenticola sp.]
MNLKHQKNEGKPEIRGVSIFHRLLLAFTITGVLIVAVAGGVNYYYAQKSTDAFIRQQVVQEVNNVVKHFIDRYRSTLSGDLTLLETMPSVDNYLTQQRDDLIIIRQEIERQYLRIREAREGRYHRISFIDAYGKEQVVVEGARRLRHFGSIMNGGVAGSPEAGVKDLFLRLKAGEPKSILFAGPYLDDQGRYYMVTGISKREPEIAGFGGVILVSVYLTEFIEKVREHRLLGHHRAWLFGPKKRQLVSTPEEPDRVRNPRPYLENGEFAGGKAFVISKAARFGTLDEPVMWVVVSVSQQHLAEEIAAELEHVSIVILITLLISLLIAYVLSRQLARPIIQLVRTSEQLREGDLQARCEILTGGEIGFLSRAINEMADNLGRLLQARDHEIGERKHVERKLRELNEELELRVLQRTHELSGLNRELEAFNYSVSHDLRAPLRGIDGFSQALLEDYAGAIDDTGKDYLMRVRRATQRMSHLIDDLLKLSRIGRKEMNKEPVDLTALAHEVILQLQENEPERRAEFVIADGLQGGGDLQLLRVVLDNLLGNAWKYSRYNDSTKIEFGRMETERGEAFFIRDNGVGFDMHYSDKLFGAFQRLHTTNDFEGTGIGLATVARIIHRHGGQIWSEAEVDKGAAFFFFL